MTDTGDPKQVRQKKTKMQLRRERETEELRALLEDKKMRDFLWRLLEQCGVYHTTFTGEGPSTFFNEGKRQIGLWVLEETFASDVSAYALMQTEQRNEDA